MNTLIIHPKDSSTTFLEILYKNIPDQTLITGGVTKGELMRLIDSHDRVMMMGHGSNMGLFSTGKFFGTNGYIIDSRMVPFLREKDNSVFVWCHADKFVDWFSLKGFYSGMFISEVSEATYCGLPGMTQELVDESNYGFCEIAAKYLNDDDTENIHKNIQGEYGLIAESNPVAFYNSRRLYARYEQKKSLEVI